MTATHPNPDQKPNQSGNQKSTQKLSKSAQIRAILSLPPDELAEWSLRTFKTEHLPSDHLLGEYFGVSAVLVGRIKLEMPAYLRHIRLCKDGRLMVTEKIGQKGDLACRNRIALLSRMYSPLKVAELALEHCSEDELLAVQQMIGDRLNSGQLSEQTKVND